MKNFVQTGKVLDLTAPTGGLVSGQASLIGGLFVVASTDIAEGKKGACAVEGVFTLPKATGVALAEGQAAYWDATAKNITATANGNTKVGNVTVAAGSAAVMVPVRLSN